MLNVEAELTWINNEPVWRGFPIFAPRRRTADDGQDQRHTGQQHCDELALCVPGLVYIITGSTQLIMLVSCDCSTWRRGWIPSCRIWVSWHGMRTSPQGWQNRDNRTNCGLKQNAKFLFVEFIWL